MKIKFSVKCWGCDSEAHGFILDTENLPSVLCNPQAKMDIFNIEFSASNKPLKSENHKNPECNICGGKHFDFECSE